MYFANYFRYTAADFALPKGVEVTSIHTESNGKKNNLITSMEPFTIEHHKATANLKGASLKYTRLNHANFQYTIKIKNVDGEKEKVMVRIWIGPLKRRNDIR